MTRVSTLTEALKGNLGSNRGIRYVEAEGDERTVAYRDLHGRALGILHHLQSRGPGVGDELILLFSRRDQFVDTFWGALLGGMVPVPVAAGNNPASRAKVFQVWRTLRRPFLCTTRPILDRLVAFAEPAGLQHELQTLRERCLLLDEIDDVSRAGTPHPAEPDDPALIQFSSGSTSTPKGVVLTHRNLLTNIEDIIAAARLTTRDATFSWMPLTHDMGLIGFHLTPVVLVMDQHLMATELFIRRPRAWLEQAGACRATVLCSPNFGYKHYLKAHDPKRGHDLDLSAVRLIFNGAEPISVALCEEFLDRMSAHGLRRATMFPVYGLAEASLAVTFPEDGGRYRVLDLERASLTTGMKAKLAQGGAGTVQLVTLGRPLEHCALRIAAPDDAALPAGTVGHVQISGPNVTAGYYTRDGLDRTGFTADGWLDTGDLGFLADGELVVVGRTKEMILVNGQNYYPHDLESVVAAAGEVELGKIAVCAARAPDGQGEALLAFVLFRGDIADFAPLARRVATRINAQTGLTVDHVLPVDRIPKTSSGKIQRYLLAERYEGGEFAQAAAALERLSRATPADAPAAGANEVQRRLQEICTPFLGGTRIGADDNIFELGTSSLTLAQIYEQIERLYPDTLEITDFFDYPTLAQLAAHIERKRGAQLSV